MNTIIGAGLTGLIAAHAWPRAQVFERESGPPPAHAALLRFRTRSVADVTGIEFRPVRVHKGLWLGDRFIEPSIRAANMYAQKCMGTLDTGDRSIWNLAAADRFIAPPDFHERLLAQVGNRIHYSSSADDLPQVTVPREYAGPVVSTIPLEYMAQLAGVSHDLALRKAKVYVTRFLLPRTDLFQTIYFPSDKHNCYRASITGNLLICEHTVSTGGDDYIKDVWSAFGLKSAPIEKLPDVEQRYGKIAPEADDAQRRGVLFDITERIGVYSLGRFATWRNVLLDDVVQDITVIKRMIASGTSYGRRLRT